MQHRIGIFLADNQSGIITQNTMALIFSRRALRWEDKGIMRTVAEGRHASRMGIAAGRLQKTKLRIEPNCCIGILRSVSR